MSTADLSVFLANYNHARYLPRALDAILSQSVRPREVIVLDDTSTDDSPRILSEYAHKHDHVRVVRNERNLGVVATYNRGIAMAQGKYLFLAAADDFVVPGFFEKAVAQLEAHPQAGMCCGYESFQKGDDGQVVEAPSGWCAEPTYFSPDAFALKLRSALAAHAAICRRDAMVKAGGYLADLAWYSDWFAYLTIAFRHGIVHVPATLAVRTLGLAEQYSAGAGKGEKHVAVLGALLDRLMSPEYADIAPYFRRTAVIAQFGPDLIRAAARRPDRMDPAVLGLVNGLPPEQCEGLLSDTDPNVRELAGFFLAAFWRETVTRRAELEAEVVRLREELEHARRH
ncbi:MAG TPA: glycosyltransferase family A protein, partial [Gemmataceae bacterium]|nr:glycosyltransferase family A protein [Gemmataceae bacterium]